MSDAKFHLVARASILASGDSDDFHHVAPDEVVMVAVEALEQARRERDEWQEWHHVAVRERDRLAVDALAALAGAGIATPEKGYVAEPWALAGDIARLAKERDEARASATRGWEQADSLHMSVAEALRERDEARDLYRETEEQLAKERTAHDKTEAKRDALKAALRQYIEHGCMCAVNTPEQGKCEQCSRAREALGEVGDDPAPQELEEAVSFDQEDECPTCRAKPGSPTLCAECLERRALSAEVERVGEDRDRVLEEGERIAMRLAKERDEYRALYEAVSGTSKRDIAERQREACAKAVHRYAVDGIVRATPLVTDGGGE